MAKNTFKEFSETILNSASVGSPAPQRDKEDDKQRTRPVVKKPAIAPSPADTAAKPSINENYIQRSFYLREDLSDKLALISLKSKRSIKAIMNELVQAFVDKNNNLVD